MRCVFYAAAPCTWNAIPNMTHPIGEDQYGWTWITWFFQPFTITQMVRIIICQPLISSPSSLVFYSLILYPWLCYVEDGPYQERAKVIYSDLRSNLIRYLSWNILLISKPLWQPPENCFILLQKCCSQLLWEWFFVGTVWPEEGQGKRCSCVYRMDIIGAVNDGRSLYRELALTGIEHQQYREIFRQNLLIGEIWHIKPLLL